MLRFAPPLSRRFAAIALICGTTVTGVGAATMHRFTVSQATGAGGATAFLQSSASGGALQGQVATTVNTTLPYPFGVFGDYNLSGSTTFGIGVVGASTTGYGVGGESTASQAGVFAYNAGSGSGMGLEAVTAATSSGPAIYSEAKGSGDGGDFYADVSSDPFKGFVAGNGDSIFASSAGFGIVSLATDAAIVGTSTDDYGVVGQSSTGVGVFGGTSGPDPSVVGINYATATPAPTAAPDTNAGLSGYAFSGPGVYGTSKGVGAGAFGVNISTTGVVSGEPAYAQSGVVAMSMTSTGLYAASSDQDGIYASGNTFGIDANSTLLSGVYGSSAAGSVGELGEESGTGVAAFGAGSSSDDPALTVTGQDSSTPDLIRAFSYNGGSPAVSFAIQGGTADRSGAVMAYSAASDAQFSGDVYVYGHIYQDCTAFPVIRAGSNATPCDDVALTSQTTSVESASGTKVAMYGTHEAAPRVETDGGADMVNGRAYVAIDPHFAQTMSMRSPYRVFITPSGDSRGVYVSNRTPRGFEVHENAGGRSSMEFDYRIVAEPFAEETRSVGARGTKPSIAAIPDPHIALELRRARAMQIRDSAARASTSVIVARSRAAMVAQRAKAAQLQARMKAHKRFVAPPIHPLISAATVSHN